MVRTSDDTTDLLVIVPSYSPCIFIINHSGTMEPERQIIPAPPETWRTGQSLSSFAARYEQEEENAKDEEEQQRI